MAQHRHKTMLGCLFLNHHYKTFFMHHRFLLPTTVFIASLISLVSCRREALTEPAASSFAKAADEMAAKKAGKPGHYIKASEDLEIPAIIAVPEGSERIATYYAEGVQRYKAEEVAGLPGIYQWTFVGPLADLYAHNNHFVGTHGSGPYWALSPADSIFGQHFTPARTAPSPIANTIDWLLLKPKSGTTPTGIFSEVKYIQRIATAGGKAPALPPVSITDVAEVPYKAVYRFSK
jgi:hypothetical protein